MNKITNIEIDALRPSPTNPRKHFDQAKIIELAESIRAVGILQPIIVRGNADAGEGFYEIVAGERRYRAGKEAGLTEIPAIVRAMDDAAVLEVQVIENLQRDDLTPLEEAAGFKTLLDTQSYSVDQIATKLSKSRAYVYQRMKLLELPASVTDALAAGKINVSTAVLIARVSDEKKRAEAIESILTPPYGDSPLGYDDAKQIIDELMCTLGDAPFGIDDDSYPEGACSACAKMTKNDTDLFGDDEEARCTDMACFRGKVSEFRKRIAQGLKEKGYTEVAEKAVHGCGTDRKYVPLKEQIEDCFLKKGATPMTWKQAAGKDCPVYFAIDGYNKPGLYLKTEEAIAAAKASGNDIFKKIEKAESPATVDWAAEHKKQEEAAAANLPIINACAEQLLQRITSERISMKQAMMAIAETMDNDERIESRRGKYSLEKMDAVKLIGFCLESLLWNQAGYSNDITDSDFKAFCKRFGIDIAEAKKTAETAKPAPKEAKKKSA